ncbi:hypothetical protein EYF80_021652 [Liparis tanakae]|uniref:Uncharacterized protein n=1 Tax=Liparis tanakae TaxID=230148 RepID=A0A4Z2HQQ3_9TELE|nr:hypothetical protein EYF80_021652 [Liparis tanakae]
MATRQNKQKALDVFFSPSKRLLLGPVAAATTGIHFTALDAIRWDATHAIFISGEHGASEEISPKFPIR